MKWVDEDEQDGDVNDPLAGYNMGAGGLPDMGDLDFSKLSGNDYGAGAGGMDSDDENDTSDDDMPDLEAEEGKGKTTASSA